MTTITDADLRRSVADALQFVSHYHPPDFVRAMAAAHDREDSAPAKAAMAQILRNSRLCALGRRPICQDTGVANVTMRVGLGVRFDTGRALQAIVDDAVRDAYAAEANPLRASMVRDPLFDRRNTGDNAPGLLRVELVEGDAVEVDVSAKGGGSENKARFTVLDPGRDPAAAVADWVVSTVETLGAGWCPPGILGIGVGGGAETAMCLAKDALNEPVDMDRIRRDGPSGEAEALRLEICDRVNALGLGAQGLGGMTAALDVKLRTHPAHAASLPVALIPNCAATRHVRFRLDGSGPARFEPPDLADWPDLPGDAGSDARRVDLDAVDAEVVRGWRAGETLLLSGRLYTGRDAAHKRMCEAIERGEALPVDLRDRAIYYVGPVDAVGSEVIGPAGPTTATRMDRYLETVLPATGLRVMIGKAERGPEAVRSIARHGAVYLTAVGGAAFLVAQAIRAAKVVAWPDLGMEAIYELEVRDMPVTVAVDVEGRSVHVDGPAAWRRLRMPA